MTFLGLGIPVVQQIIWQRKEGKAIWAGLGLGLGKGCLTERPQARLS